MTLKKVLIIRLSSIGDIVLTTPVVRNLKLQQPGIEIHYVVKPAFASIVQSNPYISKVHLLDQTLSNLLDTLKKEKYDLVVDLHKNFRSCRIRFSLGVPVVSFHKLNIRKWLAVRFKWKVLPPVHIVDRYLQSLQKFGIVNDGQGLDYFIPEKDHVDPEIQFPGIGNDYLAVVVGAKHNTKQLPVAKLIPVISDLNLPVVLLGGKDDEKTAKMILEKCQKQVFNACGKLNLNQSASLIRQAGAVLTNDTGLMHIAAALKKPIISVWGNTIPEFGMYPYYPDNIIDQSRIMEVKGLKCRPCSKIGFRECPEKHFDCMMKQDETMIRKAIMQVIGGL